MTSELKHPLDRDDGKPWVPFEGAPVVYRNVEGCRERVELTAWYDVDRQRLVLTLTHYDETMREFQPCWAQVAIVDAGPFMAPGDVRAFADMFTDECHMMLEGSAGRTRS